MITGYNIQHNPSESSTSTAEGPGIVNFLEYDKWKIKSWEAISKLNISARTDLLRMYNTVRLIHSDYGCSAMKYKKANHPKVVKLKRKFEDSKKCLDQYIVLAILSGHTQ